ncbi:MAG: hypothetical protein WC584_01865 [Candidatus Pacearchaeota archaeon]
MIAGLLGFYLGLNLGSKDQSQSVKQRTEQRVERKNSLEYQLPNDFKDIISISPVGTWGAYAVTYKSNNEEIKFQFYNSHGTTSSLPITWKKPGVK